MNVVFNFFFFGFSQALEINKKKENQFAQWVVVVRKIN